MAQTIFNKILAGEIPCHRVYENEHVLAFLDIGPLANGHTLVIPKEAKTHLHELSEEAGAALGRALVKVSRAVREATGCEAYNVLQNNGSAAHQEVMHVHFHVIPKPGLSQGLGISWKPGTLDQDKAAALAASISAKIC